MELRGLLGIETDNTLPLLPVIIIQRVNYEQQKKSIFRRCLIQLIEEEWNKANIQSTYGVQEQTIIDVILEKYVILVKYM